MFLGVFFVVIIFGKFLALAIIPMLLLSLTFGTSSHYSEGREQELNSTLNKLQVSDDNQNSFKADSKNDDSNTNIPFKQKRAAPIPIKIITNSLLVKLKVSSGQEKTLRTKNGTIIEKAIKDLNSDIKGKGGKTVGIFKQLGILHVKIGNPRAPPYIFQPTRDAIEALQLNKSSPLKDKLSLSYNFKKFLESNPAVEKVYYDAIIPLAAQEMPTGVNRVDADRSPTISGDGNGMTKADIAILDTGVDVTHPDLNVVECLSFVGNELFDPFTGDLVPGPPLNNCTDNVGHGTHVAGIVAALDNGIGVVGTAPGAKIHAIKICEDSCEVSDITEGLNYVASHYNEIDVVNLSLGGYVPNWLAEWWFGVGTEAKEDAIKRLVNTYGVVVVAAAGNDNIDAKDFTPARVRSAITVSSISDYNGRCGGDPNRSWDDSFSYFSNYGSVVDLAAPGYLIESTIPMNIRGHPTPGYGAMSGTSMAAPHVTGAAALYLSLHPAASPSEVEEYLKSTGTKAPNRFQESTAFSCDHQGKGYFSTYFDRDSVREPLLYMGWGVPPCPPDCPAAGDVDNLPSNDADGDGIVDGQDNCANTANSDQKNTDLDDFGNACDKDDDGDGVDDSNDNCVVTKNHDQNDTDEDGIGNVCDPDDDNDKKVDTIDNCPVDYNPDQKDSDHDRVGDVCDFTDTQHQPPDIS
jgi:subtilisin family serine protease